MAGVLLGEMFACTGEWRGQELVEMWRFRITGWEGMRILSQRNRHRVEEVLQQVRLESFEWRYEIVTFSFVDFLFMPFLHSSLSFKY